MKIQLDTKEKTIAIEEAVNLGELTKALSKLLPNGEWKKFTLETNTTIEWANPYYVRPYIPTYPWYEQPWITWATTETVNSPPQEYTLTGGTYNIEIE